MRTQCLLACWLICIAGPSSVQGQEKKSGLDPNILYLNALEVGTIPEDGYAGIDQATVAAYRKIGAAWVLKHPTHVPWFCFSGILGERKLDLSQKFPDAPVDFGLHFTEGAPMTDAGMKQLSELKHLTFLHLTCTKVTAAGLKELKGLKKLKRLQLQNAKITDEALRVLREVGLLHTLVGASITWPQWGEWESADAVRGFSLMSTPVTDAGVKELAVFKNLEVLNLVLTSVTGTGLKELAGLEKLRHLELSKVTDEGLKGVASLKNLTSLEIFSYKDSTDPEYAFEAKITDAGLKELSALKNLKTLDLGKCPQATEAGIAAMQKALPDCKISVRR
jgi:hypothetical protein